MTLRELIKRAVEGLEKDFYSEKDRETLVEYILDNSILTVSKDTVELKSYNLFGVGEENKDRELPYILDFILFYWCKTTKEEDFLGYNRKWRLESFYTLEELEEVLANDIDDGECVVLIDGCKQSIKVDTIYNPFCNSKISWGNLEPYTLFYVTENKTVEERYNSKSILEKRILELYTENGEKVEGKYNNIRVENNVDNREYGFTLTGRTYVVDVNGNKEEKEPTFIWHTGYYAYDI